VYFHQRGVFEAQAARRVSRRSLPDEG